MVPEPHWSEAVRVRGVRQELHAVQQPQAARAHRAPEAALALPQPRPARAQGQARQGRACLHILTLQAMHAFGPVIH